MIQLNTGTDLVPTAAQDGQTVTLAVRGEVDLHSSPELRTALLDILAKAQPRRMVINLAQVPYMDSSAIAVLVEALQRMRRQGGKIWLTTLQPRVRGLLEIARLDTIFGIAATDAEALQA